jgi:YegS/Rv2252/BmrU family lipid kinase
MEKKVKLIFNPHANRGRAWNTAMVLQSIVERSGGGSWAATEYPGHATILAEQACQDGFDVVAALGGDGTVHEVVNGIMRAPAEKRPVLGAVPLGSGNDFCSNNGIAENPELAMQRVYSGDRKTIDLGCVIDDSGRMEYIDNTLGIGFDAAVTIHSYSITRIKGFAMYLLAVIQTILRNHEAPHMTITTDSETFEDNVLMLVLCNGPREGGGFFVAPEAKSDDGIFNYAMLEHVSRPMMFRLLPEVMRGTHGRFKQIRMGEFKKLKLASDAPFTAHIDGEVFAGFRSRIQSLEVEVLPQALEIIY